MDKRLILLCALASCSVLLPPSTISCLALDKEQKDKAAPAVTGTPSNAASLANEKYGKHLEPILNAIQATPDQRKQITEVFEDFRPKIQPLKAKYKEAQSQFLNAMMTGKSSEEIMLKQQDMNALYSRVVDQYCALHLRMRKLLTPNQIDAYEQYRTKQGWNKQSAPSQ
jgi:Spy/CpxP family protein refolding chaperone